MSGLSLVLLITIAYAHTLKSAYLNTSHRVRRETFEINLRWDDGLTFYRHIIVKDDPFAVQFDTMSDMLWIPSTLVNNPNWCEKGLYNIPDHLEGLPEFAISVHGGELKGQVVCEEVVVGDIVIPTFTFGAAHEIPPHFTVPLKVEGNFGLARTTIHPSVSATLLEAMYAVQEGFKKLFSIKLCPPENGNAGSGKITFGEVPPESSPSQTTYIPLIDGHHWMFTITKISYRSMRTDVAPMQVTMNTVGLFIMGPRQFTELINKHLPSYRFQEGIYFVDCAERLNSPTVVFHSVSAKIEIDPKIYIIKSSTGICFSAFQGSSLKTRTWSFGTAAHRYSVVTYDEENKRIGFAAADCP